MDQAGDLAGWWGEFVWEIAQLVSVNSAHPAVDFDWRKWGGEVAFQRHICLNTKLCAEPRCLAEERENKPGSRE